MKRAGFVVAFGVFLIVALDIPKILLLVVSGPKVDRLTYLVALGAACIAAWIVSSACGLAQRLGDSPARLGLLAIATLLFLAATFVPPYQALHVSLPMPLIKLAVMAAMVAVLMDLKPKRSAQE